MFFILSSAEINRIVDAYGNNLLRVCYLYLKDRHLAEDAVQETFIKVFKAHHKLSDLSKEKSWILSIAINICKNYFRTFWYKRISFFDDINSKMVESLSTDSLNNEEYELLKDVIKLKPIYKEVIILRFYEGFKINEISKILNITPATASVRVNRALKLLKQIIVKDELYEKLEGIESNY